MLVIAVAVLLHSQRLHEYLLTSVQQKASESLGVYGGVAKLSRCISAESIPPPISTDSWYTEPRPTPILRCCRWSTRASAFASSPFCAGSGISASSSRPPRRPASRGRRTATPIYPAHTESSNGVQPLFDLAIRHAVLDHGQIYYNDRQSSLGADMRNLVLNAGFNPARNLYTGQLAYSDGHFKSGALSADSARAQLQFEMTPSHLDLRQAELRSGRSTVPSPPPWTISTILASRPSTTHPSTPPNCGAFCATHKFPLGLLQLDGHADYAPSPTSRCSTRSPSRAPCAASAWISPSPMLLRTIRATRRKPFPSGPRHSRHLLALQRRRQLRSLTASLLSGTIEAHASIRNLTGRAIAAAAHSSSNGISLADLKQLACLRRAQRSSLSQEPCRPRRRVWKGSPRNLLATADATVNASAASTASPSTVPITGEVHASYRQPRSSSSPSVRATCAPRRPPSPSMAPLASARR